MNESLKTLLLQMSLECILQVIEVIKDHEEIVAIEVKTKEQAIAEVKGER